MKLFRKRKKIDRVEERFQTAVVLVKDLDKKEFNRLMDGLELAWKSYDKIRQVQTIDEKELSDVEEIERTLEKVAH